MKWEIRFQGIYAWEMQSTSVTSESRSVVPDSLQPCDYTVHGILYAGILECVAFLFSKKPSQPRDRTQVSHNAGGFFTSWATREALLLSH